MTNPRPNHQSRQWLAPILGFAAFYGGIGLVVVLFAHFAKG